jgi:AAA domain
MINNITLDQALKQQDDSNNQAFKIDELLEAARIDVREEILPPKIALKQIQTDGNERILCSLGNFTLISGKAKSRKSFLIVILIAALISDKIIYGIKGCLPINKRKGIFVDTEQGKYHVQLSLKRICKLSKIEYPDNLDVIALRKHNPSERLKILEYAIYNTPDLGFVVIDGIKDLITSINDEAEASMIISKLLKWSEELDIHIIIVLHQNKSDNNARGHIGTEAINKAETHLSVLKSETDKDISIVEPQQCRNREPEPFAFEIIEGMPELAENYQIRTESKSSKIDVSEIENYKLFSMLNSIYSKESEYTYSNLVIQVKLSFKEQFQKAIGDNKAKEIITFCKNNDWLKQDGNKKPYLIGNYEASV